MDRQKWQGACPVISSPIWEWYLFSWETIAFFPLHWENKQPFIYWLRLGKTSWAPAPLTKHIRGIYCYDIQEVWESNTHLGNLLAYIGKKIFFALRTIPKTEVGFMARKITSHQRFLLLINYFLPQCVITFMQ